MRTAFIIARREFLTFLAQPVAYVALAVFLVTMGSAFFFLEGFFEANEATMRNFFEWGPLVFIIYLPALSMRLMAEERRAGTMELLITLPVREIEVVAGKLLGAVFFLILSLVVTFIYPVMIMNVAQASPDLGMIVGGYIGLLLVGTAYLSLGVMASSWTHNQIVALIMGALFCAFFYFVDAMAGAFSTSLEPIMSSVSFRARFQNIARGVLDTRDVIFYLGVTAASLSVAAFSLEGRKWR